MSKLKFDTLSSIAFYLKRINTVLPKPRFSSERISFKNLYTGVGLLALALVLMISVLIGLQSKRQEIIAGPVQEVKQQVVIIPSPAVTDEKSKESSQSVTAASPEITKKQEPMIMSKDFHGVKGQIKLDFGWQMHPLYNEWRFHTGIDILGAQGQKVSAIQDGQVSDIFQDKTSGLTVIVKNDIYKVYYGSLSNATIAKGSFIKAGEEIGKMGNSDAEPYYHLHLAIKKGDEYIDPKLVVSKE
jgi:murein DD-endopeptidase MepM/ murein hydrolase activator NlpD